MRGQVTRHRHRAALEDKPACLLIDADAPWGPPPVRQRGELPPQVDEAPIPGEDAGVGLTRQFTPLEPRAHVCGRVLRIW